VAAEERRALLSKQRAGYFSPPMQLARFLRYLFRYLSAAELQAQPPSENALSFCLISAVSPSKAARVLHMPYVVG
jgi:hypothetical protein